MLSAVVVDQVEITGADLTNANLTGADLSGATGMDRAIWSNTTCPNGTVQSTPCQ